MKHTLSLKRPLSLEQQAKIFQLMGHSPEKGSKVSQDTPAKQIKRKSPLEVIKWLEMTYPQCFNFKNPKPLKKGIFNDILNQELWNGSKTTLRAALTYYSGSMAYHKNLLLNDARYDLEGNKAEPIIDSEKDFSKQRLAMLKMKKQPTKRGNSKNAKSNNPLCSDAS